MMQVTSIISTKGGVGKTTISANLGGFLADAGLRVLLLDLDIQPTLSSYYKLRSMAACGMYELIASNEIDLQKIISRTTITNLDLVFSNDGKGHLNTLLLHAPDGRFRLRNIMHIFEPHYDLVLIDTQGARSVMLEMAIVASDKLISPVTPDILAAREFRRGTLELLEDIKPYSRLGITVPKIEMLMNRVPSVSKNARLIQKMLRELFQEQECLSFLETNMPAIEAYATSAINALPVHRVETRQPSGRRSPAALDSVKTLACELFPEWSEQLMSVTGKSSGGENVA